MTIMNWYILGALLVVYPLFGLSIIYVRNRLGKTKNPARITLVPAFISFVLGIGFMVYAIIFGQ